MIPETICRKDPMPVMNLKLITQIFLAAKYPKSMQ